MINAGISSILEATLSRQEMDFLIESEHEGQLIDAINEASVTINSPNVFGTSDEDYYEDDEDLDDFDFDDFDEEEEE